MNEVDQHLLQLITAGDQEGWRRFVQRFQPRLFAFALKRVRPSDVAEDLVQETFVAFLSTLANYRGAGELESYLFQILRHRIIDHYRRSGLERELPACDFRHSDQQDVLSDVTSNEQSVSWYVRQSEHHQAIGKALTHAVGNLARFLQSGERFKELKIAEGLFYARLRNQQLAVALGLSENEIAIVKRRLIQRLRDEAIRCADPLTTEWEGPELGTDLLYQVWEAERPSCPKRSTLGKFTLGILPAPWTEYVDFHVHTLGCTFCRANLDELNLDSAPSDQDAAQNRLYQSTIGFLGA